MNASLHGKTIWLDLTEIQNDGYVALSYLPVTFSRASLAACSTEVAP